jgi:phosphoglycerol transferase MdoB-like AlkP superfamily enzyme
MHDAVEAEVQLGLVELEQLLEQVFSFWYFWLIAFVCPLSIIPELAAVYWTAQRMVKSASLEVCCASRRSNESINVSRFSMISSSALKMSCRWRRCCFSSFCSRC